MSRANFVQVQLAQAATDIQTTLVVNPPVGGLALPPADGGRLVLTDSPGRPMAFEVVDYTGRTGSGPYTLTGVTRGVEGTVGLAWGVGTFVLQSLTVGELNSMLAAKVNATDPRLADAREWTGATVSQAEAEAGLATTRRAWTAQRVRQAIVAWWNTSSAKVQLDEATAGVTGLSGSKLDANANAVSATKLATARTIGGVAFDGTANISLPGVNAAGNQSTSGNAATATKLATARTINGVSFDGTANIVVADATKEPVVPAGTAAQYMRGDKTWQDLATAVRAAVLTGFSTATSTAVAATDTLLAAVGKLQAQVNGLASSKLDATANAVSATKLAIARTIGGVSFDGTADINLPGVNAAGNQNTSGNAATATKLANILTTFTGTYPVTVNVNGVIYSHTDVTYTGSTGIFSAPTFNATVGGFQGVAADSAAAPSFTWTGDLDTGMWRPAADTLGFATGGVNRITINSAGISGAGAGLTGLNAANLASGIVPDARLSGTYTGVSITGNAATATKLATARTIGGVAFDGTANISLPGVNAAGNQSTSGNAATATKLATARTINGVSFDGTANITVEDSTKLPFLGGTLTGPLGLPTDLVQYAQEKVQALGAGSGTRTVTVTNGAFLQATANSTAATWTFTIAPTAGYATAWTLELTNGGLSAQTFTGVLWAGGKAPTLTASGVDVLVFSKVGSVVRGYLAAKDSR